MNDSTKNTAIVVSIAGQAKHGKTTFGKMLAEELGQLGVVPFTVGFADALKSEAASMLGIDESNFYDDATKEGYRTFMQGLGDARKVSNSKFYWADKVSARYHTWCTYTELNDQPTALIITDSRYDFEAEWANGQFIKAVHATLNVVRPGASTTEHSSHCSEAGISPHLVTHTINNIGNLSDLQHQAWCLASELVKS